MIIKKDKVKKLILSSLIIILFSHIQPICGANNKGARATILPHDLRCEYLDKPLGLDVQVPRFSWKLKATDQSEYGQLQKAYRILVSQSRAELDNNNGDMWDSGWKDSDQTHLIAYDGKMLSSDRKYYWKVIVKDQRGKQSEDSETSIWTTGLLSKYDWYSKWIGTKDNFDPKVNDSNIYDPWFRKKVKLDRKPHQATIFVASVGFHELYVNGQKVGDQVMAPAATDNGKHVRYVAYDIASQLEEGDNIIALWLGTSWSIYPAYATQDKPQSPIVRAQCIAYDADMNVISQIQTDESWKTHPSPNKLLGRWYPRQFGGEIWDANKDIKDWNNLAIDDSKWNASTEYFPNLKLTAQKVEHNQIFDEINPIAIEALPNGDYRVDMGVNFAGWTRIKIKGEPNSRVDFLFSEREQNEITFAIRSAYLLDETGIGVFQNKFNYSSGRWITIKGLTEKPKLEDIKGWLIRTAYKSKSSFESSSQLQNWMYDRILWTFNNLSIGGMIVDCPQRERMGYGGDAHATSETGIMNFDMGAFYTKWMEDWRDVQGTEPVTGNMHDPNVFRKKVGAGRIFNDGRLPHTAPTYWGGGGPPWGGICVSIPWMLYQNEGDIRILEDNMELIKGWLAFLDSNVENDLLKPYGSSWDFLSDWLWPNAHAEGMNISTPQNICYNNSFRVYNLRTAAKIARVIGQDDYAQKWEKQADESSKAINEKYFNVLDNSYADGSMACLAAALIAEVPPLELREKVVNRLEYEILEKRKGHIHVGITAGGLLFNLLREMRRDDLLYSMTSKSEYPSWGFMKDNGATSIWEMWEKDLPGHSLMHSSFLYPAAWYIEGLSGIRKIKGTTGYQNFEISIPQLNDPEMNWARSTFNSANGSIEVYWKRNETELQLEVTVPPNCKANLYLPSNKMITTNTKHAKRLGTRDNNVVYELVAGQYKFQGK